ncbi:MAG: 2,3-bisphosphoglycerate-independent phosphoglycerate mutase [Bacteroidales bacterium]|nr:2,3-bisphosphoglycerate-independent phosphoglycerate mutase [Bacteroidales bacterium]
MNKTILCIIDGLGINPDQYGNATLDMPNLWNAMKNFPSTQITASGFEVGLADEKDAGNSEVGHNAIGAGQHIKQGLALLNEQFESGQIFESDTWKKLSNNAKNTKLNIFTLISDGRLHSDIYNHLFPMLKKCAKEGIKVSIHGLLDGRDVATQSAMKYINDIRDFIAEHNIDAKIATVAGRSVLVMDRYETDTKLLTNTVEICVKGNGTVVDNIQTAIEKEYASRPEMTDETMPAFILEKDWLVKNGDSVLLLNYRGDRAVETCQMFENGKYLTAEQYKEIDNCVFAGVLQYDAELEIPKTYLCPPPSIKNTLSEWLVSKGVRQYSVTETVKFGHLTYFFNGNRAKPFNEKLEIWKEFPSDVCANMYNTAPKMQTEKIVDDAIANINNFDFIKLNLPGPDMVGHTGDFDATVTACKTVDIMLGKLIEQAEKHNVNLIITSDHGNAEFMKYENGDPRSAHTNSPVPFIILPFATPNLKIKDGKWGLTNIASTVCELLGVEVSSHFNESTIKI